VHQLAKVFMTSSRVESNFWFYLLLRTWQQELQYITCGPVASAVLLNAPVQEVHPLVQNTQFCLTRGRGVTVGAMHVFLCFFQDSFWQEEEQ